MLHLWALHLQEGGCAHSHFQQQSQRVFASKPGVKVNNSLISARVFGA